MVLLSWMSKQRSRVMGLAVGLTRPAHDCAVLHLIFLGSSSRCRPCGTCCFAPNIFRRGHGDNRKDTTADNCRISLARSLRRGRTCPLDAIDEAIRLREGFLILWEGVIASDWVEGELTRAVFVASPGMSSCFCWFGLGHPRWYRDRFFSRVRLQYPHDQIADQIADGRAAERSFDRELRDHVLCERQFGRSFLARHRMLIAKRATSAAFAGLDGGVGTGLSRGRRRLMPKREHVTCSEPTVTPINSAISSRRLPCSTRFLICSMRSGVNLTLRTFPSSCFAFSDSRGAA